MGQIRNDSLDSRLTHPLHQAAHAYWSGLRGHLGSLPGRQHVDPLDIPDLLPWVNLMEVHRRPDGLRFRHRLVGTGIVEMSGSDPTGRWLHDIRTADRLSRAQHALEAVVRGGEPDLIHDDLGGRTKPHWVPASLLLPLASDRRRVDMLLVVTTYA